MNRNPWLIIAGLSIIAAAIIAALGVLGIIVGDIDDDGSKDPEPAFNWFSRR